MFVITLNIYVAKLLLGTETVLLFVRYSCQFAITVSFKAVFDYISIIKYEKRLHTIIKYFYVDEIEGTNYKNNQLFFKIRKSGLKKRNKEDCCKPAIINNVSLP